MENFNNIQNKDNNVFRNVVVGTLHSLKDRIFWYNVINNEKTKVDVPVYFTVAGSERFLSDIFLNSDELTKDNKATGLYLKYPRAHVNLQEISLQEEYLTNKFKRANYIVQEGDEVKEYNAEFMEGPFKLNFDIVVHLDSIIDIFKCMESIYKNLYKNNYYYVDVSGIKVPCYFAIPPDINKEKSINFGLSDKKEIQMSFSIEVQINYPIFKEETSIFAGNRMNDIIQNLYIVKSTDNNTNSSGKNIEVIKDVWPSGNNTTNNYTD